MGLCHILRDDRGTAELTNGITTACLLPSSQSLGIDAAGADLAVGDLPLLATVDVPAGVFAAPVRRIALSWLASIGARLRNLNLYTLAIIFKRTGS